MMKLVTAPGSLSLCLLLTAAPVLSLQGCGLVVFSQHSEAAAALETLHGRFVWPGARSPMVIEWCDPNKQHKRKRAQPLAPALLQQVLVCQQQAMPCMQTVLPATSSLGYMPNGNAGRLMMPGY
jgi:hypothetical protein